MRKTDMSGVESDVRAWRVSLILRTVAVVVLFSVLAVTTYAWISMNVQDSGQNMKLNVEVENATASFEIFKYDIDLDECIRNDSVVDMNQYDKIFMQRNKYTPAIIKVDVMSAHLNPAGGIVRVIITRNSVLSSSSIFSSQVLRFTGTSEPYITSNATAFYEAFNEDHYTTVFAYTANHEDVAIGSSGYHVSSKTFGYTKDASSDAVLELSIPYLSQDVISRGDGTYAVEIFIYITYDKTDLDLAMAGTGLGQQEVDFIDDLAQIRVAVDVDDE